MYVGSPFVLALTLTVTPLGQVCQEQEARTTTTTTHSETPRPLLLQWGVT